MREVKLDARSYRADLTPQERQTLADTFHSSPTECQILVCSYWVCDTALNLHGHCRNLVFWDPAPLSVEQQALGRLKRVGAERWIRLFRLYVEDSFSTRQNIACIMKALPGLMVELNMEMFGRESSSQEEVPVGDWTIYNN